MTTAPGNLEHGHDGATHLAAPEDDRFDATAYDEMLHGVCAAYLGCEDSCALICTERCAGEDELLRWAAHYDGLVRVARDHRLTAVRATQLAQAARSARFVGDWTPAVTDLTVLFAASNKEPV